MSDVHAPAPPADDTLQTARPSEIPERRPWWIGEQRLREIHALASKAPADLTTEDIPALRLAILELIEERELTNAESAAARKAEAELMLKASRAQDMLDRAARGVGPEDVLDRGGHHRRVPPPPGASSDLPPLPETPTEMSLVAFQRKEIKRLQRGLLNVALLARDPDE